MAFDMSFNVCSIDSWTSRTFVEWKQYMETTNTKSRIHSGYTDYISYINKIHPLPKPSPRYKFSPACNGISCAGRCSCVRLVDAHQFPTVGLQHASRKQETNQRVRLRSPSIGKGATPLALRTYRHLGLLRAVVAHSERTR